MKQLYIFFSCLSLTFLLQAAQESPARTKYSSLSFYPIDPPEEPPRNSGSLLDVKKWKEKMREWQEDKAQWQKEQRESRISVLGLKARSYYNLGEVASAEDLATMAQQYENYLSRN